MAKKFSQSVIGIEITEESIFLTQMDLIDEVPTVTKVKSLAIPPRSIIDGVIADVDTIGEQIVSAFEEGEFLANNVVVALNDLKFLKKSLIFPKFPHTETIVELQSIIRSHTLFAQKDFQLGYQEYIRLGQVDENLDKKEISEDVAGDAIEVDSKDTKFRSLLFAAVSADLIDNVEDLTKAIDSSLVAIDLVSLAVMRASLFEQDMPEHPVIHCFVDFEYMDFNIVYKNSILVSHVFRKNMDDIIEEEFYLDMYLVTFKQLLLKFSSLFPELQVPTRCVLFLRNSQAESFFDMLASQLDLSVEKYDATQNIRFLGVDSSSDKKEQYTRSYLPGIGLCLKYFEPINQTLSLTKVKKKIAPIFDFKLVLIYGVIFTVLLALSLGVNTVFSGKLNVVNKDMDMIKRKIKILQAGKGGSKQSQVKDLQGSIEFYASLRDQDYSKYIFFYELVEVLPLDISFFTLSVTPEKSGFKVLLKGQSYYQDSIYLFYDALQAKFKDVSLKDIKSQVKDDIALNIFSISFLWRVE